MSNKRKKQWKSGEAYVEDKRDGVRAVLTRSSWDKDYRDRLSCDDESTRIKAFSEASGFDTDSLPPDFRLMCWPPHGTNPKATDNFVCLILPEFVELDAGEEPIEASVDDSWRCTWPAYFNQETALRRLARRIPE